MGSITVSMAHHIIKYGERGREATRGRRGPSVATLLGLAGPLMVGDHQLQTVHNHYSQNKFIWVTTSWMSIQQV